jgi:Raf kinase inhibitor-like YbhB/YbcL family protein
MLGKRYLERLFLIGGAIVASWSMVQVASAADPFTLTSSAFKDGTTIPLKFGGNLKANANCIGENVSPQLAWSNPPAGTKSFAFLLIDPEGRGGRGVIHTVLYGIPASLTGFAEGEISQLSDKFVAGKGSVPVPAYLGPCAPAGAPHHYTFMVIATDLEPGALQPGLTRDELHKALNDHAKGIAGLVGLYAKP